MTHFLIVLFIAMIFSLPSESKKLVSFRLFKWKTTPTPKAQLISFIILLFFMALRYEFGNDYGNYRLIHSDIQHGYISTWHRRNFLFVFANIIITNFHWLIAILSFCYLIVLHSLMRKNLQTNQYWFALLLLLINPTLFLIHLSAIRQAIAIAIFILAIHLSQKKLPLFPRKLKYNKIVNFAMYSSLIILASGMHTSAILLLPVYFFLNQKKVNRGFKISLVLFIVAMLTTPLYRIIINIGLNYFPQYEGHFTPEQGLTFGLGAIINTLFFFLLILLNINKLEGKEIVYGKLYLIATTFTFIARVSPMITRVGMYFDTFIIIALPLVFSKMKKGYLRNITFACMMLIYVARLRTFFTNPMWWSFWEYRTIFG